MVTKMVTLTQAPRHRKIRLVTLAIELILTGYKVSVQWRLSTSRVTSLTWYSRILEAVCSVP